MGAAGPFLWRPDEPLTVTYESQRLDASRGHYRFALAARENPTMPLRSASAPYPLGFIEPCLPTLGYSVPPGL
jgi:hypothetical protein